MHPSSKLRSAGVALVSIVVCLIAVSGAGAGVVPTLTTTFTQDTVEPTGTSGATTIVTTDDNKLGSHADFTADIDFNYGPSGATGSGGTVKSLVIDTPPGLVGNPNAIPYEDRCDVSVFETGSCPASATVGTFQIDVTLFPDDHGGGLDLATLGGHAGLTRVSLLKTDPEVPAQIGIYVKSLSNYAIVRTKLSIAPLTDQGLRLRTITLGDLPNTIERLDEPDNYALQIRHMRLKLWGKLPNGRNFMTNPLSCETWHSQIWANTWENNDNPNADPFGVGTNTHIAGAPTTSDPDCSNAASVPFPISGGVAISTPDRNTSPAFDFTVDNPGVQGDGQVSSTPKKIVTTVPASINVDVAQVGRTCPVGDFMADNCPLTSKVGSVKIDTPLIRAGLSGNVYLVKRDPKAGLPDLGLYVTGAITFVQLGSNQYVGPNFNQIETTFDNIPQVGFTKLTFHLDGGPNGLLRSLKCPTYNKSPAVPNFTYNFTSWTGASATSTTPLNMANCFGIQTLKSYPRCLSKKLPVHPNYQSRARVKSVSLKINGKQRAKTKKSPFRFDLKINKLKLKKGKKYKLELKAVYDDGTVSAKTVNFKTCK
ncbi:MAG: hypothetical protein QM648_11135 [Solirubrobacterales bacterium]